MIKIEFPADRTDIAAAIGRALLEVSGDITSDSPETHRAADQCPGATAGMVAASQEQLDDFKKSIETITAPTSDDLRKEAADDPREPNEAEVASSPQQDTNGVPFDPNYCSKSDQPFYTSGKHLGCWKKRRGLDQSEYDAWYASQLQPAAPVVEGEEQAPVDVAAALTGQASSLFPDEQPADGPKTAGELMVWVSEQQVAGHITQEDVQAAYQAAGCQNPGMLFADEAAYVGPIHAHLADKVSA